VHFTKLKLCRPRPARAVQRSGFDRFQPTGGRLVSSDSGRAQIGQAFQVPMDTIELLFQPVGRLAHIPHSPITRAPLPPGKDRFNFTPDRTEPPVDPHRRWPQLLSEAGLAQNPVGQAVFPAPFVAGLAPVSLVGHSAIGSDREQPNN
jgi:hypothetical protein